MFGRSVKIAVYHRWVKAAAAWRAATGRAAASAEKPPDAARAAPQAG